MRMMQRLYSKTHNTLTKALLLEEGGGSGRLPVKDLIAIVGEYNNARIISEEPEEL